MLPSPLTPLSRPTIDRALADLCSRDPHLARIVADYGPPPMWAREPGFSTLVHIILEQQVSLASARAAYERLLAVAAPLTPKRFLELDDAELKAAGFSRQKARYGRELASAIASGQLDLDRLHALDDEAARTTLTQVKGIGRWTANIYLLLALRRPDIWPAGDLALATAAQRVMGLRSVPAPHELEAIGAAWRPWRAVAARLLWHYYLSNRPPRKEKRRRTTAPKLQPPKCFDTPPPTLV
jgi:DNA-3-methyladenine glycosylase II